VAAAVERGVRTVAHVRPDSSSLERWRGTFEEEGAEIETAPWTPQGMAEALGAHHPDFVFSLLGTTAKRAKREGGSYEEVDYGLTVMLLRATVDAGEPPPCFVYLSAAGAGGRAVNAYMKVRVRVEEEIRRSGVPHLIARPGFITGPGRDEDRPAERMGAAVLDGALGALAALGVRAPLNRWGSLTGPQLGGALVALAVDGRRGVVEVPELRAAAGA
jgi:hypothetical protein